MARNRLRISLLAGSRKSFAPEPPPTSIRAPQKVLGLLHHPEGFRRNAAPVRNARSKAGHGGLFPRRKLHPAGELPDFNLVQTGLDQRGLQAELGSRLEPRPVVVQVPHVGAVGHPVDPNPGGGLQNGIHDVPLADIAAIGAVGGKLLALQFVRGDDEMTNPEASCQLGRRSDLPPRVQGGVGRDRRHPPAENLAGEGKQEGAVHTAGKSHHQPVISAEDGLQALSLRYKLMIFHDNAIKSALGYKKARPLSHNGVYKSRRLLYGDRDLT